MVTIALAGCAHIHLPGFVDLVRKHPQTKVKYVWDSLEVRARVRAGELGAQALKSPSRIWNDPEIAGVAIYAETNLHKKLVLAGARANKSLFVEKPLGLGAKDSALMAGAVEQAGVRFNTGYLLRSQPVYRFIKQQIDAGAFGHITRVRGCNCHSGSLNGWFDEKPQDPANSWRWMADPALAGCGAFGDLGTHLLDLLMWYVGDIESVSADIKPVTGRYGDCDETGEALIKFKNGVIGTLAGGWVDLANPLTLQISGTEGHAAVINNQVFFTSKKVQGADGRQPWTQLPQALPHPLHQWLDALTGRNDDSLVSVREAAARSAATEAMYTAARRGKWISPR